MPKLSYFSPVANHAIGGVKIFYRHAEIIDSLAFRDWQAQLFHWEQPDFRCTWFEHRAHMKTDAAFKPAEDFAILPECHLWGFWRQLSDLNVRYGIFVQNGYLMNANPSVSIKDLKSAYQKASLVLTVSEDTAECVRLFSPESAHKIVPIRYSIAEDMFRPSGEKENIITFMPRKMREHSSLVLMFLLQALPSNWKVLPIDGVPEAEVAKILQRSKIFLSFSSLEGVGLPPAEAALCGNYVVGYSGEGGKEYWEPGLFTEVAMGNIRGYVEEVLRLVRRLDSRQKLGLPHLTEDAMVAAEAVRVKFSLEQETSRLRSLLERVDELMPGSPG